MTKCLYAKNMMIYKNEYWLIVLGSNRLRFSYLLQYFSAYCVTGKSTACCPRAPNTVAPPKKISIIPL